jgi:hypothetical protein
MKAIVRNDFGFLRVRAAPSTDAAILGIVAGGLTVEVLEVKDNWAMIALLAGGAPITIEESNPPAPAVGYMFAPMLDFGAPPPHGPVPVSSSMRLGVHSMTNGRAIQEADQGCKFVMCMNSFDVAEQIKHAHPDAVVMVRRYWGNGIPGTADAVASLGGATNAGFVYTGLNEADALGQDGADLRRRATFDLQLANAIRQASGATYAAGSFSVGCPDFTSQQTCDIIRELYAPAYNNGLIKFDMHLYSPTMNHIDKDDETIWHERRWEFLFTRCGFDPTVQGIYCSETGVDEFGRGGFPGHSASQQDFKHWCEKFIALQQKPLVVNGTSYPSPFVGAALFQLGGNGDPRWDAYDIAGYLPTLRTLYIL